MKALITGANGFAGSHLSRTLAEGGAEVTGLYIAENSPAWDYLGCDVKLVRCDVTKKDEVDRAVAAAAPDVVFHLAAVSFNPLCSANPELAFAVNTTGTANVAEAVLAHAPNARLVFASSCEVYGKAVKSPEPIGEDAVPEPVNPYPESKLSAEKEIGKSVAAGLDAVIARPFSHTGIGQEERFVVHAFASQVARAALGITEKRVLAGNVDVIRDFSDVADIVRGYLILAEKGTTGGIYNIASGIGRRVGDVLGRLISLSGAEIAVEKDTARLRPADIPVFIGDASKIRALGWRPEIDFDDTLRGIYEYYLAFPGKRQDSRG